MVNLTDEITRVGGSLTMWEGQHADRLLADFSATDPWVEFPTPDSVGPGRYFGYDLNGEIAAFLSVTAWRIVGATPLKEYLRNVDEFDDGKMNQGLPTWTEWEISDNRHVATVECAIGPAVEDFISKVTYVWSRNDEDTFDEMLIISLNSPKGIADNIHYSI